MEPRERQLVIGEKSGCMQALHGDHLDNAPARLNRLAVRLRMMPADFTWPLHRPSLAYPDGPYPVLLAQSVARHPDRTAIIFRDQRLTYRERATERPS